MKNPKEVHIFITPEEIRKTQISYKESKQEELQDLLDKKADQNNRIDLDAYASGLYDGANWQKEKSYSEEEVRELFSQYKEEFSIYRNMQILNVQFEEWFENFKKK